MSMSYKEACKEVGYDPKSDPVAPIKFWYGYKNGKAVQFTTKELAVSFSRNIESVVINSAEIAKWKEKQNKKHIEAVTLWVKVLKEDYLYYVSGDVFDLCYDRAYDRGHSSGYDEVALILEDEIEFARRILATKK